MPSRPLFFAFVDTHAETGTREWRGAADCISRIALLIVSGPAGMK